jgi:transcriptional regulator with XRE-family HTH domain
MADGDHSAVRDLEVGRLLRMLRIRRGWRLRDVADRCGLSVTTIGRTEQGWVASVAVIRAHAAVLDVRVEWRVIGRGAEVIRLLDEEHAAIVEVVATRAVEAGMSTEAEVSYSEYGERGRIDLMASKPGTGVLAVVEVKTELADLQDLFGSLNAKGRLAPTLASRRGWATDRVVIILALAATAANRSVVSAHPVLFRGFTRRWLHGSPLTLPDRADRLLLWVPARAAARDSWLAGRRRVRRGSARRP